MRVAKTILLSTATVLSLTCQAELVIDGPRAALDLGGEWQVQSIQGIDFTYPPPADGTWTPVAIPERPDTTIKGEGPYYPSVPSLLTKDGKGLAKTDGVAFWYKRNFDAPQTPENCGRILLRLHGATFRSETWFNGTKLGTSFMGLLPFEYDVTAIVKPGATNELAIALTGRAGLLDIPNQTYLYPSAGNGPGLWGAVELVYLPAAYIEDVFVKTSVKDQRIVLETTVVNTQDKACTVKLSATIRNHVGTALTTLGPVEADLPAGASQTVDIAKDWIAPELWSPENPALLWAETKLAQDDTAVDETRVRFGFREFEIRGHDFYLNGIRTVLLRNSWLASVSALRSEVFPGAKTTATHPYNCFRFHIGFDSEAALDSCDELGIMSIPESSWHNSGDDKFPVAKTDLWLPGVVSYTKALIKHHRNRPSVIIWSLTNESIWGDTDEKRMVVADALVAAAKEMDPTRPCQGDAEVTWGGRLPIINIHYPESTVANALREKYPNAAYVFPNDCHWLKKNEINGSWRATFNWDRPLVIGEYWFPEGEPDPKTSFMGESVYDHELWNFRSMAGREGRTDSEFYKSTQMITDAYRMDGVAGMNPWACENENLMKPRNVRPVDFFPNLAAGQTCIRKFVVFNDTQQSLRVPQLQCRLTTPEGRVLWEKIVGAPTDPGTNQVFDVPIDCPASRHIQPATLSVKLRDDRGGWTEIASYDESVFIVPPVSLADIDPAAVAVFDPDGKTAAALASLGLKAKPLTTPTNADLAEVKALVVGEQADPAPFKDVIAQFAKAGGVVVVLRQEGTKPLTYELPEIDPAHITTRSWMRSYDHPILKNLSDSQFSYWRPDHLVACNAFSKPTNGPAKTLLDAGGRYGLRWAPLVEVPSGKGIYVLSQLYLADKVGVEPMAAAMLERIVRFAATRPARETPPPPLRVLADNNQDAVTAMTDTGVEIVKGLDGKGPVFIDASYNPSPAEIELLKQHLADGGSVWLHNFGTETIGNVAALFPFKPELESVDPKIHSAIRRTTDPLMNNLSSFDFCWTKLGGEKRWNYFDGSNPTAKLGTETLRLPTLDDGIPLIEPKLLVKVPVGQGTILFDSLAWDKAIGAESERVARIAASLAANLGANVRIVRDETVYDYFHVDFAPVANMGFYDKTADDGVGGWTDQGQNDMRFFLINHSGRGGGRDDAMEVEVESFPALVTFLDRPFKIPDPRKNNGTAVISLRGEMHGAKLPSKVEGIKVNAKADRLWFLHSAGWTPPTSGVEVGRYVVHYEDGTTTAIPVRFNIEVSDWWNPQPLTNGKVAWTGRNLATSPLGFYMTEWRNSSPEKTIATIDVVGNLAPTQFVCLGITGGVERKDGAAATKLISRWLLAAAKDKVVENQLPAMPSLRFGALAPTPEGDGLRFKDGASLNASSKDCLEVFNGTPFSLRMKLEVDEPTPGSMGGLFQRMQYLQAGFRLVAYPNLTIGAEIFPAPDKPVYLATKDPLKPGQMYDVELRFDGKFATLLIDNKLAAKAESAPPAACEADISIGNASGKDYYFDGVIASVELLSLPVMP